MEIDFDAYLKAAGGKPTERKKQELEKVNEMLRARGRQRVVEGVIAEVDDYDQVVYVAVKNNNGKDEYWRLDFFPCTDEELVVLKNLKAKVRLTIKLEMGRGRVERCKSIEEYIVYMDDYLTEAKHILTRAAALEALRKVVALGIVCMEQNGAPKRREL